MWLAKEAQRLCARRGTAINYTYATYMPDADALQQALHSEALVVLI